MKYSVKTLDITLTPAISDYLEKKLSRIEKFISPEMMSTLVCDIELGKATNHHKTGDVFVTAINIVSGSVSLNAKAEEMDLYASIDVAVAEMGEILKAAKGKRDSLLRKGGSKLKSLMKKFYSDDTR